MANKIERNPQAKCTHCGLCRTVCPAYKVLKDEIASPRAKNVSIYAFVENKIKIDGKYFFEYCNGCEACVSVCPVKSGFDVIKAREFIVKNWFISPENQQMIDNIKQYRNPFWELKKWSSMPDKLYCC